MYKIFSEIDKQLKLIKAKFLAVKRERLRVHGHISGFGSCGITS